MSTDHSLNEAQIEMLESQVPSASGVIFQQAQEAARLAGLSVMVSEDGALYEVLPCGQRRLVKQITPPTTIEPGSQITIR